MNQEDVVRCMEAQGFEEISTGGGCTAWSLTSGDTQICVTDDASHELGDECWVEVFVGGEPLFGVGVPTGDVLKEGRHILMRISGE